MTLETVRPQEPRSPLPYVSQNVVFSNTEEGHVLAGTFTVPTGAGPFPAAVLISGSGPQDRDETLEGHRPFFVLSDHLTRGGVAVLRFDDRGVGESGGDHDSATPEHTATDVLAAVQWVTARPEVHPEQVGLIGHSEGGLVAPIVAARTTQVAFIALLAAPGLDGETILLSQAAAIQRADGVSEEAIDRGLDLAQQSFELVRAAPQSARSSELLRRLVRESFDILSGEADIEPPEAIDDAVDAVVTQMNSGWFRYLLDHDPGPVLEHVRVPVLVIAGDLDQQVLARPNVAAIEAALARGGNDHVEIHVLPGLNHLFQHATTGSPAEYGCIEETIAPEALDLIRDWVLAQVSEVDASRAIERPQITERR